MTDCSSNDTSPLPPLTIPPFSYGNNGFTVNDICRVHPHVLRYLLFPRDVHGKRAQKEAIETARETVTKEWLAAQLHHYGVGFRSSAEKGVLQELLEIKIKEGECDEVPSSILDIENELRNEYKFSCLDSPSDEANFDVDLFLSKYFLDDNGKPDRFKTREPLLLAGLTDRASMHEAASNIAGLHTKSGEVGYLFRVLVVGWDSDKVYDEASRIDVEEAETEKQGRIEKWEKKMQKHRDYVARCKAVTRKGSKAFQAKDAVGGYVVECKDISKGYDMDDHDLTMNIVQASGPVELVADFDLGIIEGIMRLGFDAKLLSEPSESEIDDGDESDEESEDDDEPTVSGSKRKRAAQLTKPQSPKKSKSSKAHPRRLYLQWRGQETGEGEILLDDANEHTGHLDFTDAACTAFEGVVFIGYIGPNVPFRGFKVSGDGRQMTKSWSGYSGRCF